MALAADVLHQWREAERVLGILSDDAPERPAVVAAVEEMRHLYQYLVREVTPGTEEMIARSRDRIEQTHSLLRTVLEGR